MQLLYYIESDNVRGRFQQTQNRGRELYIQTGLLNVEPITAGNAAGYAQAEIQLYNVSAKQNYLPNKNEPMIPRNNFRIKVLLKRKFSYAYESQNEYLFLTMPLQFLPNNPKQDDNLDFDPTKECIVLGAAVCEE